MKLGLRYLHGDGVEKNVEEAVRIFRLAAKASCAEAEVEMGKCFHAGKGVEKEPERGSASIP